MDFQELISRVRESRYINQRVLPYRRYEDSKYTDYNQDERLYFAEQERVDILFMTDCRKAFENYLHSLNNDQWSLVWSNVHSGIDGQTYEGVLDRLIKLAPLAEQLLFIRKRRTNRNRELSL